MVNIYSVAISKPYTITASGDGYLKFWSNHITETDTAKENVKEVFVHKTGLHHVAVFEDFVDTTRIGLVATVSFSGEVFFYIINQTDGSISPIDVQLNGKGNRDSYWAIQFSKDEESKSHKFGATQATGVTKIWSFTIDSLTSATFTIHGEIKPQTKNFATSLDISYNKSLLATGFKNGDVVLTQTETSKPVYTFHNFGLKGSSQSSSTIRSVKFSPLGTLLAVASDSGSYGTITLYDTIYGENVGNFTIPSHSTQVHVGAYAHEGWVFEIDFNETGELLVSSGYDGKIRVWNVTTREREATIALSITDYDDDDIPIDENATSAAVGVKFIDKGIRGGAGGDSNDGLAIISLDRGIRWFREAGGI
ncbi:putative WD repeat-containing protein [Wickerhamomyces ciferrii]|uniref:WD repeat-containing protein n=1 Tax=Wickerhamomyces ciferrii (strain ATCC 14091 / BCRC 22168 / CBS 111 / JCM 3599 / NBRC 0793 / NRRL Y-1031 F-60-10) TaxID=1206466 RepID=K0KTU3_WICCF|nr:putative WD repeat-containing protein [Wickerhamomyces ciferrii]CCH44794.1 putative WD repeat-containing protein [Wickerhamomyces ciferrii]